uniref:Uncharacterized protein n=1 Tax=Lepeophtheirus salmonis TaxID=72036 RepID=A0A0K2THN8_LEPSM
MCGLRNSSKLDKISIFLRLFVSPDFLQKIWSTSMEELIHFCKSFSQVVRNTAFNAQIIYEHLVYYISLTRFFTKPLDGGVKESSPV